MNNKFKEKSSLAKRNMQYYVVISIIIIFIILTIDSIYKSLNSNDNNLPKNDSQNYDKISYINTLKPIQLINFNNKIKEAINISKYNDEKNNPPADTAAAYSSPTIEENEQINIDLHNEELIRAQQSRKSNFDLNIDFISTKDTVSNFNGKNMQASKQLLITGTIISAILTKDIMSDYADYWLGMINKDVYDATYNYILIPIGSKIVGKVLRINNINEAIQNCIGLTVKWIILPNGKRILFENKSKALSSSGIAGIADKVDYHLTSQFLGVTAYALISNKTNYNTNYKHTYAGDVGNALRKQTSPLASKYLSLSPTVTINSGTAIKIFIEDDIMLQPFKDVFSKLYK